MNASVSAVTGFKLPSVSELLTKDPCFFCFGFLYHVMKND
jgi:hypothetical protein